MTRLDNADRHSADQSGQQNHIEKAADDNGEHL